MKMRRYHNAETISIFKHRFIMPDDVDFNEFLKLVENNEIDEFSQKHIDEFIIERDEQKFNEEEVLKLFDKENDYLKNLTYDQKMNIINFRKKLD